MTEQRCLSEFVESEQPALGRRYIIRLSLMALFSLVLQVGLILCPSEVLYPTSLSISKAPLRFGSGLTVTPGNSVHWKNELWVSAITGNPYAAPAIKARAPSSRVVAIDLNSGTIRETGITLTPSPVGLLAIDDELWAVSETTVHRIKEDQSIPRYPRRALIQPTMPFAYQGRLAVIDRNKNNVCALLTWNDGEWSEIGKIEVPEADSSARWSAPELQVRTNGKTSYLFYSDGQTIWFREGLEVITASDPVSALHPENEQIIPLALMPEIPRNKVQQIKTSIAGWKMLPIGGSWGVLWDVALIDDELWAFCSVTYGNGGNIQQYKFQNENWITPTASRIPASNFSVASGPKGYIVCNGLRVYGLDGSILSQKPAPQIQWSEWTYRGYWFLILSTWYSLGAVALGIGTWWLMRMHRSPRYVYGKREVVQASMMRRGIARAIDTVVTTFPAVFWFWITMETADDIAWQSTSASHQQFILFTLISVVGMWVGGIVGISFTEGYWGITPGKWLCGIRTFRTTLRPCGMVRSLARELLIYVDSLLLLQWSPGILLIAFTKNWQRLGDLAADTVVVMNPHKNSWFSNFNQSENNV